MRKLPIDRNIFLQIGLDSGSLTMLGSIAHSFGEPGEYRGTIRKGRESVGVFYISVDTESAVAQVDIDLSELADGAGLKCDEPCDHDRHRFTVNPKGYALFRVSSGSGGYDVLVRRADAAEDTPLFDSRTLSDGSVFAATILRPGRYKATNAIGEGAAEVVVSYPKRGRTAYRPPAPRRVRSTRERLTPERIKLSPAQGLIFDCEAPSRIVIELEEPDDGSRDGAGKDG
ncbi:MAG TPA: hypothetical protein VF148_07420 [Acidimicrobiia bacterium]